MVAAQRAAHQLVDRPVIHTDPLALRIIGEQARSWLEANPAFLQIEYVRAIRSMVAIRSRLCEDELARAVGRGTRQYVVLGAGLDTFAFRQPAFARQLSIFEVDEPATQAWKLERLQAAGIAPPENLRFVPVDFNEGTLGGALASAGFDRAAPAFFAWLGVSYYLPLESILDTMRFIAGHGAASEVIFDIALAESAVLPEYLERHRDLYRLMSTAPEPWLTWLDPGELRATLLALGFTAAELVSSQLLLDRFQTNRPNMAIMMARKAH